MTTHIKELREALNFIAPKLCPDYWGKSILTTLSGSEPAASSKQASKIKKQAKVCSLCSDNLDAVSCSVIVDYTSTDCESITPQALLPICSACKSIKDLNSLIELVVQVSANPSSKKLQTELATIATHFLRVNGHDLSNAQAFHSALNTAFTLSLLCRSLPLKTPYKIVS